MTLRFPNYKQQDSSDCGPTCLRIVSKFYGIDNDIIRIKKLSDLSKEGVTLGGIAKTATLLSFKTAVIKCSLEKLHDMPLPCIIPWSDKHFIVLYKVKTNKYFVSDPAFGLLRYNSNEFLNGWYRNGINSGLALLMEPKFEKDEHQIELRTNSRWNLANTLKYFSSGKNFFIQNILLSTAIAFISLALPFFIQFLIDKGIGITNKDLVVLILLSEFLIIFTQFCLETVKNWLYLEIGSKLSIQLTVEFLNRVLKLPPIFHHKKHISDIIRRFEDHANIIEIFASSFFNYFFSICSLIFFLTILFFYLSSVFYIYVTISILLLFIDKIIEKKSQTHIYKLQLESFDKERGLTSILKAIDDIKINCLEDYITNTWREKRLLLLNSRRQSYQFDIVSRISAQSLRQLLNVTIAILSAFAVIDNQISLGMMFAILLIIPQTNGLIKQIEVLRKSLSLFKTSKERISEIISINIQDHNPTAHTNTFRNEITIRNIYFRYDENANYIFKNFSMDIHHNKINLILGSKNCGKTTLSKILLKLYDCEKGSILIDNMSLKDIDNRIWRNNCSAILNGEHIYAESILKNIVLDNTFYNDKKLKDALEISNLKDFVKSLPHNIHTKILNNGLINNEIKQKLIIARAIYKGSKLFILDEFTSNLCQRDRAIIMSNLKYYFNGKTVIMLSCTIDCEIIPDRIVFL